MLVAQSNSAKSSIKISDSVDVDAVLTNIVNQANIDAITIANTEPVVDDIFAQVAGVNQINSFESSLSIENSGKVNAALTNSVTQTNTSTITITNTDTAPVSVPDSFTQSANTNQSNDITSNITITSTGKVEASDTGISATITNADIVQINDSTIALDSSGVVDADSFTQSANTHQSNEITSNIAITNSGKLEASKTGIAAMITNADITQINFGAITVDAGADVNANNFTQSAKANQRNDVTSNIAIINSGLVEGGDIGVLAQITDQLINQINFSQNTLSALSGNMTDAITVMNSGSIFGGRFGIAAVGSNVNISNTGLVHAYAPDSSASATGIGVTAAEANITNRGGTIWAGFSTDGGATIHRGVAIETINPAVIQLQGTEADGHIYGDINIGSGTTIETTQGKTWFEGTINGAEGALGVFGGGELVLCQEGWIKSCDPDAWDANWDPQEGADKPSLVVIDTFSMRSDGTISPQLTPRTASGTYPQVFAKTANLRGALEAQYLPGFYTDKFDYDNVIKAGSRIGTFEKVGDNSLLLNTEAVYEGNNVDLSVTRTAFNEVSGLTKNQGAVAGGIEHIYSELPDPDVNPATTTPFDQTVAKLFTIDNKQSYRAVLDQLTGAQYAQELQSVVWSLRPLNLAITDRMDCTLNDSNVGPVAKGPYSNNLGAYRPYGCFKPGQVQAWARAWGGWNNNDGDINAPGYDETQWGIWGGADYAVTDAVFVGFAGGFSSSLMDFERFGGAGASIKYDGGQIAGYGAWDNGVWYNRAIVSAGFYSGESHRSFAFESPAVATNGSPDADAVSFYNELGGRIRVGPNVTLTPFLGIIIASADLDSFTERDPQKTGTALRVSHSDANSVASILGVRFNNSWGAFKSEVALGWEHEFDDTFQTVDASFAAAPSGSNFKVIGADLGDDALAVDVGTSYTLGPSSDLSVRYVGRFLEDYDAQSVMGRWTYKFGAAPVVAVPNPPLK